MMTPYSTSALSLDRSAGSSHFSFRIRTVPDDSFTVAQFTGEDHGLSQDFFFTLSLITKTELTPKTVIGNSATLEMRWGGSPVFLHGVVSSFHRENDTPTGMSYRAVVSSPLSSLKLNTQNRVFINRTVPQILEEVLIAADYVKDDFSMDLNASYPVREFVVQYNETDYDFIIRLLAHCGIFFTFESDDSKTRILFCDQSTNRPVLPGVSELMFQPQTGAVRSVETIYVLSPQARLMPGETLLTDYNYRTPGIHLEASKSTAAGQSAGTTSLYGDHFKTTEEGLQMATIRQQSIDVQREIYIGETDCRGILPGFLLKVSQHPNDALNGDYLIINVTHSADQGAALEMGGSVKGATYKNTVQMIRANVPFRPPIPDNRQLLGLFTARVETTGTKYAYLDDQGRYRVRTDFDRGSAAQGEASHPVRLMQPYGGNNYGMHFPLHAKTEVVLACVNGDLDRPVLVGTLSNPNTPSVVTSKNNTQNIIRTAGGNELVMDDLLKRERIELFTADRKNILTLDANAEGHKVRLATEEGEMKIFAKKTLLIESGDTQTVQVGNDHIITVENAQRLMTRNKEIEFQAATDLLFKARQNIQFQAEKQNIEMTAGKDMIVEVGRNLSMEVREQEMSLLVNNGRLSMEAAKDIVILGRGGGPMTITQGGGTIQISQNGNVVLSAAKIDINGACINLKGTAIGGN